MRIELNHLYRASLPMLPLLAAALGDSHAHAQNQLPHDPVVAVTGSSYNGTLCAPGSLIVEGSDGAEVSASTALDALSAPEGGALEGSCDLTVSLSVPEGLRVGNATLC